jgi:carbon monoxide dehydrogenase subunit G
VWEVVSDPARFEEWMTLHVKWKGDVPTEFSEGSQVSEVVSMLSMPNTITWTVDEYQPPRKVTLSGTGMAGVKATIKLDVEPAGEGSEFSLSAQFEGQMIVGALGKAIEKEGLKQVEESVDKLKSLLA